ncbi:4749_t:CDS:2 [Paraglomus brasilianum]|uniref:4749_t:CDS:1 n=1 Tax=Paraglomus brasilianum TaxID=144538 RepID=A0A9N8W7I3_9GLOM|nr:4749_t:CDS:2 [Paraglomus brasilianum]
MTLSCGIEDLSNFYLQLGLKLAPSTQQDFPYIIQQFQDQNGNVQLHLSAA